MTTTFPASSATSGKQAKSSFVHFRDVRGDNTKSRRNLPHECKTEMLACMKSYKEIA
jgi:D-mannonate dehydratase